MKMTLRTIALILVLVMTAGNFSGCLTYSLMESGVTGDAVILIIFTIPIDIVTLPIQLIVWIVKAAEKSARDKRGNKMDGIDTFSAAVSSLPETELFSLMEKINSLPVEKVDFLTRRYNSLPESEIDSYLQTVNSFSEKEITSMIMVFNNLSEAEIASSINTFNSMPEERLIAKLNNLQNTKFHYQDRRR